MPPVVILIAVAAVFAVLLLIERAAPLRRPRFAMGAGVVLNLVMSALAFLTAAVLVRPAAQGAVRWSSEQPFGLLHLSSLPAPLQFVLAFLLMDLSFYWWHVANHRFAFLWRFHNVHHIDPALDVTTGFRFHFGEVAFSTVFRVLQVSLLGVSLPAYVAYECVFHANTLFHHSNVRLPLGFERRLNKLLVTPRMHGVHHSQVRRETNSNYGVVFPWWDRLHRTLGLNVPQSRIVIGVPAYASPDDNRLSNLLLLPFRKQRDYWCQPDGKPMERSAADLSGSSPTTMAE